MSPEQCNHGSDSFSSTPARRDSHPSGFFVMPIQFSCWNGIERRPADTAPWPRMIVRTVLPGTLPAWLSP